jgi:ABC-type multidrug transport system fused ATPase/permease subunit
METISNNFIKYTKIILSWIKYSPKLFFTYLLIQLFDWFQSVFGIVIISKVISALEKWSISDLYFWVYVFIGLTVVSLIFMLFEDSIFSSTFTRIEKSLVEKYLKTFIQFDNTKVEEYWTWKLNNIIFSGISSLVNVLQLLINIFVEIFAIVYMFVIIFTKSPNIYYSLWFSTIFLIVIIFFVKWILEISKIRKRAKDLYVQIDGKKVKILMSKFEILQNDKIEKENNELWKIYKNLEDLWWKWNLKKSMYWNISQAVLKLLYVVIFLVIWVSVINKEYDIATFALLIWLIDILSKYAWDIRGFMRDFMRSFIDIEKLVNTFENIPKYKDDSFLPDFNFKEWNINFENINFWYNEKNKVFENFSLDLKWGKKYAFVWLSGSWKSTLLKLLAWYINPNLWEIIIDNQKLSQVKLKTFYKNIWYLSQEPWVFDWTIYENLVYALDFDPNIEKIDEVIKLSKCEFIYDLLAWVETQIWERWVKLSGWQKQRLAIAKIMLKNPKIILLDEPTSALDSFNEEEISIALKNLFKNKTVITVAHRLQTVKNSDKIFYMENWKIIEEWNHEELLNKKWKYFKMIELQSWF